MMKQKALQLACQLVRYGFTKIHLIAICYPVHDKIYSDKLPAAATVHFPGASNIIDPWQHEHGIADKKP